jgi:putative acetyltransferase
MEIQIRRAEPGDYEAVHKIYTCSKAVWGTLQVPYPSLERWRKRFAEHNDSMYNLLACVEGEVVGQLGLSTNPERPRRRHVGHIGVAVHDDWQGKGIGTALMQAAIDLSDRWLNLMRLELDVFVDNDPAIRLYRKFGFVVEGTLVQFAFRDGQYVDVYAMARLHG